MRLIALASVAALLSNPAAADDQLDLAVSANTSALARLENIHFKMAATRAGGGGAKRVDCEYWRSGGHQRVKSVEDGIRSDWFLGPDRLVLVVFDRDAKTGAPAPHATVMANTPPISLSFSPWREALCGFSSARGPGTLSLREQVAALKSPSAAPGPGGIVITSGDGSVTLTVDPTAGYMVRSARFASTVTFADGTKSTRVGTQEVDDFSQPEPGCFFPRKVTATMVVDGKHASTGTAEFSELRLSIPPPGLLDPVFPPGTVVSDRIQGTQYRSDDRGRPAGPVAPLQSATPGQVSPDAPASAALPTQEEPRRAGWWLLPAGGAAVCIALAVITVRRRARQN